MKKFLLLFLVATPILQSGYDPRRESRKELTKTLKKGLERESKKEWSELRGLAGKPCNLALDLFQCGGTPQKKIQRRERKIRREN